MAGPPARLGQFRILEELGHGGMGYVFAAEDGKLGRQVALKVLHPVYQSMPGSREQFLREAQAAAKLDHANIVPILHVGEDGGTPFIVMPLLRGETLKSRLTRGPLSVADTIRWGSQIAAGLLAAHSAELVHGDLKPGNVWLDHLGHARILDFGLARYADGRETLAKPEGLQGTPPYMAPEQIDGSPATARTDLFALGAILYECLTGQRAFDGSTIGDIIDAVVAHHTPPVSSVNPSVPPELSELVQRLLAKNPNERPASAAEVVAVLDQIHKQLTDATQTWVGRLPQLPRSPRRTPLLAVAVVATLLVLAGGLWGALQLLSSSFPLSEPIHYIGKVDVLVERRIGGQFRLLRLNQADALPLRPSDKFRIEGEVNPPAYLYIIWIDPEHDLTPVYPWDPQRGWGSRPGVEQPVGKVSLPPNLGNRYTAPDAKPGVATVVLLATPEPLPYSDEVIQAWFKGLPELKLPPGGDHAAVWFDNFLEVQDPSRQRTFGVVGSDDAFARWQGQLQSVLRDKVCFQSAVSFARAGDKP